MPYHLGVAKTLLARESPKTNQMTKDKTPNALHQLPIKSVSGSSSGAIAATVMTLMPHRLEEYTERFLQDRGHAFKNLREIVLEEAFQSAKVVEGGVDPKGLLKSSGPMLSICTTRCSDGGVELFSFGGRLKSNEESDETTKRQQAQFYLGGEDDGDGDEEKKHHERLLKAIEASCRIPQSFHPIDMVALNYKYLLHKLPNTQDNTYPEEEGIEIDGKGYVDGGIAAPFPPTPLDGDPSCTGRIVVSPIAGEYFYKTDKNNINSLPQPVLKAIRPENDSSWRAPWIDSLTFSGSGCRDGDSDESATPMVAVRATPSLQNLRVLTTAMGVVSASPNENNNDNDGENNGGVLRDWYERGQADAHEMLNKL